VTFYDYNAAFRGNAFVVNQLKNTDRTDHYNSVEFTMTKRSSGRWSAIASFWAIKDYRWLCESNSTGRCSLIADNPNNDFFPLDQTWRWAGNFSGTYRMPYGIHFGAFLQSKIGIQGQRTTVFRATDPDGGTPLRQQSTVTVRIEPYGAHTGPAINVLDLRTSKEFEDVDRRARMRAVRLHPHRVIRVLTQTVALCNR